MQFGMLKHIYIQTALFWTFKFTGVDSSLWFVYSGGHIYATLLSGSEYYLQRLQLDTRIKIHNGCVSGSNQGWGQVPFLSKMLIHHFQSVGKAHVGLVNLLSIIMFKIRKIKPNSGSVQQKPKSFHGDC